MDSSGIVNLVATLIALTAVIVTVRFSLHQTKVMQNANNIPVTIDLLSKFQYAEFHDRHDYVCLRLQSENDPGRGVRGLSTEARTAFFGVVYFYQSFAEISIFGIVDEEMFVSILHYRILRVWEAVVPFVEKERELRGGDATYLALFEELATRAAALPHTVISDRIAESRRRRGYR